MRMIENLVNFNGGKICYSESGRGEAIVLVHGYLESAEIWGDFAMRLSKSFRVISVNLPGHGNSTLYSNCHTMEFMSSAIRSMFDELKIKRAFLAGHSLGGYVTLAFADLFPGLLKGYCLFHSHPFADTPETVRKRENEIQVVMSGKKYMIYPMNLPKMFASDNAERFKDALQRSGEIAAKISDEGVIAVLNGMKIRPSRVSVMEKGTLPFLWILGRKDNYISCETVQSRVNLPSNAKVIVLENSGHMGFVEEEDRSVEIITDFISRLN